MDVAAILTLLTALFSAVGLWNVVIIAVIILIVFNAPALVTQILRIREKQLDRKSKVLGSDELKVYLTLITDKLDKVQEKAQSNSQDINANAERLDFSKVRFEELYSQLLSEQHEERIASANVLTKILNTMASMDSAIRHVLTGADSAALLGVKLGIIDNLKNAMLNQIIDTIESNPGRKNGQLKNDLKNDLDNIWIDFKYEFREFKTPVDIKELLSSFDEEMWSSTGMFIEIMELAVTSDLTSERRNDAISKLINTEIRKIHSKMTDFLCQLDNDRSGQYGIYNWKGGK